MVTHWWYHFFCGGTYKCEKNTHKLTKSIERFLPILFQLYHTRFHLIILEEKFRCKSQGMEIEKELFRTQLGI